MMYRGMVFNTPQFKTIHADEESGASPTLRTRPGLGKVFHMTNTTLSISSAFIEADQKKESFL